MMPARTDAFAPGSAVGAYTLEECVGRGGQAEVWRASRPDSDERIALKIVRSPHQVALQRLELEAEVQRRLRHPSIVQVHGLQCMEGLALIELEFVKGQTLLEWLTRRRPPLALCEGWVLQILDGLEVAHEQGVLHRDIKLSNILIDEESEPPRAKLADFGLARSLTSPDMEMTREGLVNGTPGYMAPEQIRGLRHLDERVDLFALGSVAYRLLTGRAPFGGDSAYEVLRRTCEGDFILPGRLNPDLPARIVRTIEAALSVRRSDRPADARTFRMMWTGQVQPPRLVEEVTRFDPIEAMPSGGIPFTTLPLTNRQLSHDRFHGRTAEMDALRQCLEGRSDRVVTLKGPGGMGKTRLADEALLAMSLEDWSGGIWRCSLASARTRNEMLEALRAVFRVRLSEGDPVVELARSVQARGRCLLMLDNLEQVIEPAASIIEGLIQHAPELSLLATSRIPIGVRGEHVIELEPMDVESASALFIDRAQVVCPGFHPTGVDATRVQELVSHLGALPLAMELAASRIRMMPIAELVERLSSGERVLGRRRRGGEPRHSSLDAAIEWSWDLLEPWEQLALAQCSLFLGGFSLDAAGEVLCLDAFEDSPWALDVLESLVDQSLVRFDSTTDGVRRFELYVSVRDYASEQFHRMGAICSPTGESLTGPAAVARHRQRHAMHYARLGEERQYSRLRGAGARHYLPTFARELPNLGVAETFDPGDAGTGLAELPARAGLAAAIVRMRTGQTHRARELLERAWCREGLGPDLRAQIGSNLVVVSRQVGMLDRALSVISETLRCLPESGLPGRRAKLLQHRGNITRQRGDFIGALAHLEEALEQARLHGDGGLIAQIVGDTGSVALYAGDLDEAAGLLEASLQLHLECDLLDSANLSRGNLGELARMRGDLQQAHSLFVECVGVARQRGNRRQELIFVSELAHTDRALGQYDAALAGYEAALELNAQVGDRRRQCRIICGIGQIQMAQDKPAEARALLVEAARLAADVDPPTEGMTHALLGLLAAREGDTERASSHMASATVLAGRAGWSVTVEVTLLHAEVALLGGDRMTAEERLRMLREGPAVDSAQWTPALEQRLVMLERRMSSLD